VTGKTASGDLVVDGKGGKATIKALQDFLNVKQTGKITVKKNLHKYNKSVTSIKYGKKDATVKAMQKWLGVKADGVWGKGTSKALQKKLGIKADGYFGKNSMKALQRYLNNH
jgi:murein L,D-transpeptidase YcbB/YkuD